MTNKGSMMVHPFVCGVRQCVYQRCISLSIAAMSSSATASVLLESAENKQFNSYSQQTLNSRRCMQQLQLHE